MPDLSNCEINQFAIFEDIENVFFGDPSLILTYSTNILNPNSNFRQNSVL